MASDSVSGMARSFASMFMVPSGSTPSGTFSRAQTSAAVAIDPSPPPITTASQPERATRTSVSTRSLPSGVWIST